MSLNIPLLKEICETPGAPGFEQKIREVVLREITPLVDEVSLDNMGNVIAIKKGSKGGKKVMVPAHIDEIGFIVNHIDENGFLRFLPLGGFDPKTLTSQRVIVHGKKDLVGVMASKPIHVMSAKERQQPAELNAYYIDLGMKKEEVEKYIEVGNPVSRERDLIEMGDCINSKSLDNRISVFILIEALRELKNKKVPFDVYAAFTVQEEVGIRGAQVATKSIEPDFGICLDTTIAYDVPGAQPHEKVSEMGAGTAIKIMDSRTICDYRMVNFMKETVKKHKIKHQFEMLPAGGTDTSAIQRETPGGSIAGAISIPTRHIHQVIEMVSKEDVRNSIDLLKACLIDIADFDWKFK